MIDLKWRDESHTIDHRLRGIYFAVSFNTVPRVNFYLSKYDIDNPECPKWKISNNLLEFSSFEANGVEEAKTTAARMIEDLLKHMLGDTMDKMTSDLKIAATRSLIDTINSLNSHGQVRIALCEIDKFMVFMDFGGKDLFVKENMYVSNVYLNDQFYKIVDREATKLGYKVSFNNTGCIGWLHK